MSAQNADAAGGAAAPSVVKEVGPSEISTDAASVNGASADDWTHWGDSCCLALGADLLPIVHDKRVRPSPGSMVTEFGKIPSVYTRAGEAHGIPGWQMRAITPADIEKWSADRRYSIGVRAAAVRALDCDIDDTELAEEVRTFIAERCELPRRHRSNSPKFLLAFTLPGPTGKRQIVTRAGKIEFLADGQQWVAAGRHPSGVPYEWDGGRPSVIPEFTTEQFETLWAELAARFGVAVPKVERVAPSGIGQKVAEGGRDNYLTSEAGHLRARGHDAETIYEALTAINDRVCEPPLADADVRRIAHSIGKKPAGELSPDCSDDDFEDLTSKSPEAQPAKPARFTPVPAHEFASGRSPEWLVSGLIPAAELIVIYGESGSGKTFLTLDLGGAVALGTPWRDRKVKQGRVVYICAEGVGGFRQRLKAYAQHRGIQLSELPLSVIADTPNLLEGKDALAVATAILKAGRASVIVVDTLSAVTPGANENAGEDMGQVVAHCKGLHRATGAVVVLIHHSGKDAAKGARGWSGLRAAADAEIEITRMGDSRTAMVTKQKDGDDGAVFGFKLLSVVIGQDEDGLDVTSCVIEHCEAVQSAKQRKPQGALQRAVYEAAQDLAPLYGSSIPVGDVIDAALKRLPTDPEGKSQRRSNLRRALDSLCAENFVFADGESISLTQNAQTLH